MCGCCQKPKETKVVKPSCCGSTKPSDKKEPAKDAPKSK